MDAYTNYIRQLSEARLGELRREAYEYALSKAARQGRPSRWSRLRRADRRPVTAAVVIQRAPGDEAADDGDVRRSA